MSKENVEVDLTSTSPLLVFKLYFVFSSITLFLQLFSISLSPAASMDLVADLSYGNR